MRPVATFAVLAAVALFPLGRAGDHPRVAPPPAQVPVAAKLVTEPAPRPGPIPPAPAPREGAPRAPTRLEVVRELARRLGTPGCGSMVVLDENGRPPEPPEIREFRKLGDDALTDCATILADPTSPWEQVLGACDIVAACATGRRFVPLLVQRLTTPGAGFAEADYPDFIRRYLLESMAHTLGALGDERDAWALVPLLDEVQVRRCAAEVLAEIGGRRELDAMNVWLAGQNPNARFVAPIRKSRDRLALRLLAERAE